MASFDIPSIVPRIRISRFRRALRVKRNFYPLPVGRLLLAGTAWYPESGIYKRDGDVPDNLGFGEFVLQQTENSEP
jgi:hypothetical protein